MVQLRSSSPSDSSTWCIEMYWIKCRWLVCVEGVALPLTWIVLTFVTSGTSERSIKKNAVLRPLVIARNAPWLQLHEVSAVLGVRKKDKEITSIGPSLVHPSNYCEYPMHSWSFGPFFLHSLRTLDEDVQIDWTMKDLQHLQESKRLKTRTPWRHQNHIVNRQLHCSPRCGAGHLPIALRYCVARSSAMCRGKAQAASCVILVTPKLGDEHRGIRHSLNPSQSTFHICPPSFSSCDSTVSRDTLPFQVVQTQSHLNMAFHSLISACQHTPAPLESDSGLHLCGGNANGTRAHRIIWLLLHKYAKCLELFPKQMLNTKIVTKI